MQIKRRIAIILVLTIIMSENVTTFATENLVNNSSFDYLRSKDKNQSIAENSFNAELLSEEKESTGQDVSEESEDSWSDNNVSLQMSSRI